MTHGCWFELVMNEWYIYIALYCALLYTQSTLQSCGGVSPQPSLVMSWSWVEIDWYIGLPIFSPIFKHFTIIGYRFWNIYIYIYFFLISHIHNYTEYNQQWNVFSVFEPSKHTHTHTHTHTHKHIDTHTHTHTHTHTWSSEHCSLRKSSSMTTPCNFIQDSLVWNTLNYINIYYRTIISPINISIEINYLLSLQAIAVWV